ncbi:hypothetical protein CKO15_08915 [Halorhodospira abdelmalekii]|uniref:hypothetical protein n=1 Tax=Halorhodospira abdelmalekii TaxID=421629 RepID=UPI001902F313|nr:hypothetical protein [Halorhodospira abdelmalekii]MBK1735402.1 hypothetical protein [Halorhodospira abdelmalekii]
MDRATLGFRLTQIAADSARLEPGHGIQPSDPGPVIEAVLRELQPLHIDLLYYDLERVEIIDPPYLSFLTQLQGSCRVIGVRMVCVHMQPSTAFALASWLDRPPSIEFAGGMWI